MTTHSDSEVGTLPTSGAPPERENAPGSPESRKSALTVSDLRQRLRTYFTLPSILTDAPASIPAKRRYARSGTWTASVDGPVRKAGVGYWRLVALPTSVVTGYVQWIADRPGRALLVYVLWRMFISNPPGPWIVEHIFTPIGHALAWLFL